MDQAAIARKRSSFKHAKRLVVKVGTPVITHGDGSLALGRIGALVEQIAELHRGGQEVVLVTSGAIGAGIIRTRAQRIATQSVQAQLQNSTPGSHEVNIKAAAAAGQSSLMALYDLLFSQFNLSCAQVLVTDTSFTHLSGLNDLRATIFELLHLGVIPVVNENDTLLTKDLTALTADMMVDRDNDALMRRLSEMLHPDLLVVLTDMESLHYTTGPDEQPKSLPIYHAPQVDGMALTTKGLGHTKFFWSKHTKKGLLPSQMLNTRLTERGLQTMVKETDRAVQQGVRAAVIGSGLDPIGLLQIMKGEPVGTLFLSAPASKL